MLFNLDDFGYSFTKDGYLIELFDITFNIINDVKYDLFKKLIGKGIPESLQTDEYLEFIFKVFGFSKGEI